MNLYRRTRRTAEWDKSSRTDYVSCGYAEWTKIEYPDEFESKIENIWRLLSGAQTGSFSTTLNEKISCKCTFKQEYLPRVFYLIFQLAKLKIPWTRRKMSEITEPTAMALKKEKRSKNECIYNWYRYRGLLPILHV